MATLNLIDQNFESEVLESDLPVLVDFSAVWCGPCQMLAPIIEELAKDYEGKMKVGKLDVDQNQALAQKYNVMGVPTVVIFKKGQEVKRQTGVAPKEEYAKLLDEILK